MTRAAPNRPVQAVTTVAVLSFRNMRTEEKTTIQKDQVVVRMAHSARGALSMAL